ncbi:DedA family protein [Microvirga flavescens]|uniref:DedA family protein n=1 Tax=Microvirga flavescens TaxID=2249811 RepID=UPI000DD6B81B|nr:DedA family protein [Microvirga flavescens]
MASIEHAIAIYGVAALFIILYFESFGAPLPGESALVTCAFVAAKGDLSIAHVFLAAWSAAVLGDSTGYLIGHFGGRPLLERYGPRLGLSPERLARVEGEFAERGFFVVLFARFVVLLRQLNGLVAGALRMPWLHFVTANALGAALWAGLWSFGPYFFTDLFRRFL